MTATERYWLLAAGVAHIALIGALSLAWQHSQRLMPAATDAVPVELVTIADAPRVTEAPKPSMEAAPQEPAAAPEAQPDTAPEPEPVKPDAVPPPEPVKPKPEPKPQAAPTRAPPSPLDTSSLANLIDKALPKAPKKMLDTSKLAKELGNDAPRTATVDPRAAATLAQAIRAQVAPCWNPPAGGRDVRRMTVIVQVQYSRDGRVVGMPEVGRPSGTTAANADYARAFAETARRAVLRCQPLKLPAEMYDLWANVEINFDPEEMT
jgi:outer membrane biosynthesis protein TonB